VTKHLRQLVADHSSGAISSEAFLQSVCEVAAERLRCTRASLWHFRTEGQRRWLRCLALHDEHPAASMVGVELAESDYPEYFATLGTDGVFDSADALNDKRLAKLRDNYLVPLNVRSVLDVAFTINGHNVGLLCCEQVGQTRQWRPQDVAEIRRIGTIVSLALTEQHAGPAWQTTQPAPLDPPSTR
jgi:GAF domain-containing protein